MQSVLGNTRKSDITFRKSGVIDLSASISKQLSLNKGDVIDILCDKNEFYLYVKYRNPIGHHKSAVFPSNKKGKHYRVANVLLCDFILKICNVTNKVSLCVGPAIQHYHCGTALPIITKYIINYE